MGERKIKILKKAAQVEKAPDDYERQHELALLRIWAKKYPEKARQIFAEELQLKAA